VAGSDLPQASPLRLRIGVSLIVLWWLPFWALAPAISDAVGGHPSTAELTTAIVVVQTLIGIVGCWIAGTQVKSVLTGVPKKQAFGMMWYLLLHGRWRDEPIPRG